MIDVKGTNEVDSASVTQAMNDSLLTRYDNDWKNWPVGKGAPYIERNGIPGYQVPPSFSPTFTLDSLIAQHYDEPGIAGDDPQKPADQVIWTVFNDLEPTSGLGNVYFKRYKITNKGVGAGNFGAGSTFSDPLLHTQPGATYESTGRWYRVLRGFIPDPLGVPERRYPFPPAMTADVYPPSGDPVTQSGFLDGQGTTYFLPPGDRRIVLSSGPFTLAPGETQELYLATVGGLGPDRLSSVSLMK